ncbi:hypothetical protein JXA88_10705 [Candidatus Fermentibacteria bacterium]|nr:hypothetical protein [Candidatus Fermentibacteria bacterium]
MERSRSVLLSVLILLVVVGSMSHAEIPTMISYQGKVSNTAGTPVADNTYTMRFRIYNAASGGTMLWDSGNQSISVSGGVFSVLLGESPQPALNLAFDADCWLLVTFAGVDQSPRQRLASTGYAYMASGLVPGTEVSGSVTSGTSAAVKGTNTAGSGTAYGLFGRSLSTEGSGAYGEAAASSGNTNGVYGSAASTAGSGVFGFATSTSGTTYGVNGRSGSSSGRGVFGYATSGTGTTYGVYGQAVSTAGIGVYGYSTASTGTTYGVYGQSPSTAGTGVWGAATAASGNTMGIYGTSSSNGGSGVFGYATSTSGATYGVNARSSSSSGRGVFGYAMSATGATYGVYGQSSSTGGTGIYGLASAVSGTTYGVYGQSCSTAGASCGARGQAPMIGAYGEATYTGGAPWQPMGVYGTSVSPTGVGVYGKAPDSGIYGKTESTYGSGIFGWADASTVGSEGKGVEGWTDARDGWGVFGWALNSVGESMGMDGWAGGPQGTGVRGWALSASGATYGVYGKVLSTTGVAVYYSGGLAGTGSKSCVVKTSQGPTLMYCQESPENWFEDFGEGQLVNGRSHIELDPLFLETVTIDEANPMKVFVELHDESCEGVAVKKGHTGFDVVERKAGRSNGTFDYRVVAKRQGFEAKRLDYCKAAETDSYLFPELREKELQELEEQRGRLDDERAIEGVSELTP